jgi:phage replication O-like protein O
MPGFTKLDNPMFEKMLTSDLTKRQLKILLLIIRFSTGYQKTYAILRKHDFSYAGVSPYCIKAELNKLVSRRVVLWDANRDLLWINPELSDWAVDNTGDNPVEGQRRFFRIATKNSTKQQLAVYQNSKTLNGIYTKKKRNREDLLLKIVRSYFLNLAPLSEPELFLLSQVVDSFPPDAIQSAIEDASRSDDRLFSSFLKSVETNTRRLRGNGSLVTIVRKLRKRRDDS